jgi:hypothetical protein
VANQNPRTGPRRGLTLTEAAGYIGVSVDKFNQLLGTGRMPRPKLIDNVRRWDIEALDVYWQGLPDDERSDAERAARFHRPAPRN